MADRLAFGTPGKDNSLVVEGYRLHIEGGALGGREESDVWLWDLASVTVKRGGFLSPDELVLRYKDEEKNKKIPWYMRELFLPSFKPGGMTVAQGEELARELTRRIAIADRIRGLARTGLSAPSTAPGTPGCVSLDDLSVGEVTRQFDEKTIGEAQGVLQHALNASFSMGGSFLGGSAGGGILGGGGMSGSMAMSGTSTLGMISSSLSRVDFMSESLMVVFERQTSTGIPETFRVLIPPDSLAQAASQAVRVGLFGPRDQRPFALPDPPTCEGSYVGDTLAAVLRARRDPAPVFSVVGVQIRPHILFGGAIRFPGDETWKELFPFGYISWIASLSQGLPSGA